MPQSPSLESSHIFISYRREDSAGHTGRLFDRLSAHFGEDQIFVDIEHMEPGEDFVQVIEKAISSCEILIAIIGRNWLSIMDGDARRLDNPNDFVRLEIAAALERSIRVIPVLVQGASMPRPQDLPDNLLQLSRRNAYELSDLRWKHDVDQLVNTLEKLITRQREARHKEAQADEQRRREAQRRQKEEQARQMEEQARRQTEVDARLKREAEEAEARRQRESEDRRVATAEQGEFEKAEQSPRDAGTAEGRPAVNTASATKNEHAPAAHSAPPLGISVEATTELKKKARAKKFKLILLISAIGLLVVVIEVSLLLWSQRVTVGDSATNNLPATPEGSSTSGDATSQLEVGREMTAVVNLHVRYGPGRNYRVIGELGAGARVRILQVSGTWVEVYVLEASEVRDERDRVTSGWIDGSHLR